VSGSAANCALSWVLELPVVYMVSAAAVPAAGGAAELM
jgi:hypothetical protein